MTIVLNSEGDEAVEDVVRLLCLIVICSLFFCISGTTITWGWVEYVECLDDMKTYDWSEAILNTLVQSNQGCTAFFMYWLCEHVKIVKPRCLSIPRVVKWHPPEVWEKIKKETLEKLTNAEVIEGVLTPTIAEGEEFRTLKAAVHGKPTNEKHKLPRKTTAQSIDEASGVEEHPLRLMDGKTQIEEGKHETGEELVRLRKAYDEAKDRFKKVVEMRSTEQREAATRIATLEKEIECMKEEQHMKDTEILSLRNKLSAILTDNVVYEVKQANSERENDIEVADNVVYEVKQAYSERENDIEEVEGSVSAACMQHLSEGKKREKFWLMCKNRLIIYLVCLKIISLLMH